MQQMRLLLLLRFCTAQHSTGLVQPFTARQITGEGARSLVLAAAWPKS
eukprot:COSAG06_NODE_58608_length_276_cov_1.129944_2_plen_47_part_01